MPGEANHHVANNGCFRSMPADEAGGLPEDLLETVLAEQYRDWISGKRIPASQRLQQYPALAADPAQSAQLIYHEFVLRQELDEFPDWAEYLRQFPQHSAWLQQLRQADDIVGQVLGPGEEARESGLQFRDYEVLETIGQGGMGVVVKARQRSLDRLVALKMMRAGAYASDEERRRFRREAQAVACLQHPNIVQIYEVGEIQGQPFLALEYVEGRSLAQRLNSTPLPARQAASLLAAVARAMDYAHSKGVIHRDLKPSNVLLAGPPETPWEECTPKVTDFGLAKRVDKAEDTSSGAVLGTPSYMAPEQVTGKTKAIGPPTDVYGLGIILYELLTGRPPFRGGSPVETAKQAVEVEPVRPWLLNPAVPCDLETICLQCLEKDPGRRYHTAQALADDLQRFELGRPIQARPIGAMERGWRWCRRKPVIAGLVAALMIAVVGGFSSSLVLLRKARAGETQALASLAREQDARRQIEEQHGMLRQTLLNGIQSSSSVLFLSSEANPIRETMLREAISCLDGLVQKRHEDSELRMMLATVLMQLGTIYYSQHRDAECQALFERAAALWEHLPPTEADLPGNRARCAITYTCLEQAYDRQGQFDRAQQYFERAFYIWRMLFKDHPTWLYPNTLLQATIDMRWLVINSGHSEAEVSGRFEKIRERLDRMTAGDEGELFLGLSRLAYLCSKAEELQQAKQPTGVLAVAREASSLLAELHRRPLLHASLRLHLVSNSFPVSVWLRKSGVPVEALALSEQVNQVLQELIHADPNDPRLRGVLSASWHHISKIHWELDQPEQTLTALRNAIEALRQALALAPSVPNYRQELGAYYVRLGRKLCELGRLDEAEACFHERQALWPGDAAKHEDALRELGKWAAQVEEGRKTLSPAGQEERRRYLELRSRLDRQGLRTAPTITAEKQSGR